MDVAADASNTGRSFNNTTHMCLVDLQWVIIPLLKAVDSFIVVIARLSETNNQTL